MKVLVVNEINTGDDTVALGQTSLGWECTEIGNAHHFRLFL